MGLTILPTTTAVAATPQCVTKTDRLDDGPGGANWMPVASNGSTVCYLHQGSVSRAVWALQRALKVCHGPSTMRRKRPHS
ncbi:hypothetical protein [Streptomyces sp. NPDC002133]|uniref:hypothetical protein n=1 Tax=Streptomyces sp. NPDC002133 TaxID=3154409 RepID=UPI00331C9845